MKGFDPLSEEVEIKMKPHSIMLTTKITSLRESMRKLDEEIKEVEKVR